MILKKIAALALAGAMMLGHAAAQTNPGQSPLTISKGGTGANTASAARTNLGINAALITSLCNPFSSSEAGCVGASGGGTTNFLRADGSWAAPPGSGGSPANPSASVGLSAVNGVANSYLRSDGAPALSSGVQSALTGTNHGVALGTGAFGFGATAAGTSGYALLGNGGSADPTFQAFVQSGTGASSRTWLSKAQETFSVKDFGAVCDGSTNDSTAFQAALTAIQTAGTGTLYINPSVNGCVISSTLTYTGQNLRITGGGTASMIVKSSTTGDLFQFSGLQNIQIDHFKVNAGITATAGVLFNFTNTSTSAGNFWLDKLELLGGYDVIYFQGGQNTFITSTVIQFNSRHAIHYGPSYAGTGLINNVSLAAIPSGAGINNGSGILAEGGDTFNWNNINIASFLNDVNVVVPASGRLANIFATNILADGVGRASGNPGWVFDGSAASAILERVHCTNCWAGSNQADGFSFTSISEVIIVNSRSIDNVGNGFHINSGSGIRIFNSTAEGNSVASSGTNSGIKVENSVNSFSLIGNRAGPGSATDVSDTQKYGIEIVGSSHDNYQIKDNDVNGNVSGGMLDSGTGSSKQVYGNVGFSGTVIPTVSGANYRLSYVDSGSGIGPTIDLFRDSASPAALDNLSSVDFNGRNSANTKYLYARMYSVLLNATAGSEQASYSFLTANGAGGYDVAANLGSGASIGSPAQGFPGSGNLNVQGWFACAAPVTKTGTSGTVGASDCSIIFNASGTYTVTLPAASGGNTGRILHVKSIAAQTINSASSNVVPRTSATAGTALLASGAGNWATLQSDGTNWVVMAGN